MSLAIAHGRLLFLETIRIPVALLFNIAFPALLLFLFVVPNSTVSGDPAAATAATLQLTIFAVINAAVLNYGVGVAEERSRSWDMYVRSLPAGPTPRMIGRILNGLLFSVLAIIPVVIIAPLLTEATLEPVRVLLATLVVLVASIPFMLGGFAIGYATSVKSAMPVALAVVFPLSFGGGLFFPPAMFPAWLDTVSAALPTRSIRELTVWTATGTGDVTLWTVPVLVAWTIVAAALAALAYRRDEGQRYR